MSHHLRLATVPLYLLLCLVLGGASAAGVWINMLLQLMAIPLIVWAILSRRSAPLPAPARQLMVLLLLLLALIAIQLVPLPPGLWTALPGREPVAEGFRLLGQPLPWLSISLAPYRTIASALWLLPAIAVLLGIVKLGNYKPAWLAWGLALVTAVAVAIGALQVAGNEQSPWYFYEITNYGNATGFFANSNHNATLLVATIPFLTALYLKARSADRSMQASSGMFVILAGALTVVIVGIAINASLAGLGLTVPVGIASLILLRSRTKPVRWWVWAALAAVTLGSITAVFSTPMGNNLTSADARSSTESRATSFSNSLQAAHDFLPLGSGVGTFGQVYPSYENSDTVTRVFVNHVHSDYIELLLETGVPGLLLLLIFLLWWFRRTIVIWSAETLDPFARAATIASAAVLAHSAADYPLRTAAISALFAACLGLMADPRPRVRQKKPRENEEQARHLSAD